MQAKFTAVRLPGNLRRLSVDTYNGGQLNTQRVVPKRDEPPPTLCINADG